MQIPLLVVAIALGIGFRLSHLDDKIFWVDEVATAIRVAGYTRAEVIQQLSDGRLLGVSDLQYYTQVADMQGGGRSLQDTFNALAQSPEHTPLYFLLTRLWVGWWGSVWGSSAASFRSLSVVASLLTLPSLYWLSVELFRSRLTGAIAVVLFALSPFFVSYAQEARPYSLWVLLLTLSGAVLLWALRRNRPSHWVLYGLLVALCAYTSLLSLPVLVGQGLYAIATTSRWGSRWLGTHRSSASSLNDLSFSGRLDNRARHALIALGVGLLTLLPWLLLALGRWDTLQDNTTWARSPMALPIRLAIWLYSLAIVVFDVPIAPFPSAMAAVQAVIAATVLGLFGLACHWLCTQTAPRTWLWLLLLALPTPLALGLIDGVSGGQVSATSRYLMPAQLALLLALAGMFGYWLESWTERGIERGRLEPALSLGRQRFWTVAIAWVVGLSLISCLGNLGRSPDYQKARNIHNPAIAALLNPISAPVVLAEPRQALDLISLSYALEPDTRFQIDADGGWLTAISFCTGDRFWFNPSPERQQALQRNPALRVTQLYRPRLLTRDDIYLSLWQIQPKPSACPDDSGNAGA